MPTKNFGVGDLRMLIEKSGHSIVDLSLTLVSKTLRIHQRLTLKLSSFIVLSNPTLLNIKWLGWRLGIGDWGLGQNQIGSLC